MKFFSILFLVLAIVSISGIYFFKRADIPSSYIPWEPLDLEEQLGPFSKIKLGQLEGDYQSCQEALDKAGVEYTSIGEIQKGECALSNQVTLNQSDYRYSDLVSGKCPLVAALIMWETNVLQPLAQEYFESDVAEVRHAGIFSCRNISGSSRRSQHAYAKAIDITGFKLENGEVIRVLGDWGNENNKAEFLKEIQRGSCRIFNGVLGPNYNEAHRDHFHLDLGPYRICR